MLRRYLILFLLFNYQWSVTISATKDILGEKSGEPYFVRFNTYKNYGSPNESCFPRYLNITRNV